MYAANNRFNYQKNIDYNNNFIQQSRIQSDSYNKYREIYSKMNQSHLAGTWLIKTKMAAIVIDSWHFAAFVC